MLFYWVAALIRLYGIYEKHHPICDILGSFNGNTRIMSEAAGKCDMFETQTGSPTEIRGEPEVSDRPSLNKQKMIICSNTTIKRPPASLKQTG